MKLSRALLERRNITKKIARGREEIESLLVTPQHQNVGEGVIEKMIEEADSNLDALLALNLKIEKANSQHLSDDLNKLRILDSKIVFMKKCRTKLISENDMRYYSRSEVVEVKNIPVSSINEKLEVLETERNDLDAKIQEKNWTVEV